jgi:hypothetical protein
VLPQSIVGTCGVFQISHNTFVPEEIGACYQQLIAEAPQEGLVLIGNARLPGRHGLSGMKTNVGLSLSKDIEGVWMSTFQACGSGSIHFSSSGLEGMVRNQSLWTLRLSFCFAV